MHTITLELIREKSKLTISEVASHCGVTVSRIKELESNPGEMPVSIALKLRKLYGVPFDYIEN